MKKKLKLNVIFLIVIIVIASYIIFALIANIDELEKDPYTNTEHGWRIKYPLGWKIIEIETGDIDFIDESSENILYIRVEPPKESTSKILNEEIEKCREIITDNNFVITSERDRVVNNMNSFEFIYKNEDGQYSLKEKRILIEKDGRVFNIIYIAEIKSYDEYDSLAEKCINTFEIL